MSARTESFVGVGYVTGGDVDDLDRLADAVMALFAAFERTPTRLTFALKKATTRAFRENFFRSVIGDPSLRRITVWSDGDAGAPEVKAYLRDDPESRDTARRQSGVLVPGDADPTVLPTFLARVERCVSIVAGGGARYRSRTYAIAECYDGGVSGETDRATESRLDWDGMYAKRARTKLRRLYPITIIGPAIWATLPPMPAFDPMPVVEDLGPCKLLRAWPTLCEPRDPDFLRGTRALREWLWPFTIQNPADSVDNDPAA